VKALSDVATVALREWLAGQPASAGSVAFAWRIAAGSALARATSIEWGAGGVLRISATDRMWRRELVRVRPLITERLRHMLGSNTISEIVIAGPDPADR
jgi:Dna[CI] antecedent DciA-like protein